MFSGVSSPELMMSSSSTMYMRSNRYELTFASLSKSMPSMSAASRTWRESSAVTDERSNIWSTRVETRNNLQSLMSVSHLTASMPRVFLIDSSVCCSVTPMSPLSSALLHT